MFVKIVYLEANNIRLILFATYITYTWEIISCVLTNFITTKSYGNT